MKRITHLNEMQDRPGVLETINLRMLQDLLEDWKITQSDLTKFKKLRSEKWNEQVIKYINDFDKLLNDNWFSDYIRGKLVELMKKKSYKFYDILWSARYTFLKLSVRNSFNTLMNHEDSAVNEQTNEIVQKAEKHVKTMNTAKTEEKKEKEVKIGDLKEKLNEWTKPQKLEDILPFLRPLQESVEYEKQLQEATNLLNSGKMDEAISLSNKLKGKRPQVREFTDEERREFSAVRAKLAEQLGYKVIENDQKRFFLQKDGCSIQMKHFLTPSFQGINGGRIQMLEASKWKADALFDNVWVKKPKNEDIKNIIDEIVSYFN